MWNKAKRAFEAFRWAQSAGDRAKIVETLTELDSLFQAESSTKLTAKQRIFCLAFAGEANGNGTLTRTFLCAEFPEWKYWKQPRLSSLVPPEFVEPIRRLLIPQKAAA